MKSKKPLEEKTKELNIAKTKKQLREIKEMRFREDMNLWFFIIFIMAIGFVVLYFILK